MHFLSGFIKCSTSSLALGYNDAIFGDRNTTLLQTLNIHYHWRMGRYMTSRHSGYRMLQISSSFGITAFADVEVTGSTTENLE